MDNEGTTPTERAFYAGVLAAWSLDEIIRIGVNPNDIELAFEEATPHILTHKCAGGCIACLLKVQCAKYSRLILERAGAKECGR